MKSFLTIVSFCLSLLVWSQNSIEQNYDKKEVYITMRDGVKLFTSIYIPKDISKSYNFV